MIFSITTETNIQMYQINRFPHFINTILIFDVNT